MAVAAEVLVTVAPRSGGAEKVRVVEYTDPYSIWCWGCEPAIRRLEMRYPDAVEIDVKMGGLFEDFEPVRAQWARMSGGKWQDSVLAFMNAVADQHRMPMDPSKMVVSIDDFRSTWPACVAVKAAEAQGTPAGRRYLRRLREAALTEGRRIHRREVQLDVAFEAGLDANGFALALDDDSADRAFRKDLEECRTLGITGFPTFEVKKGFVSLRVEGWQPWEVFDEAIHKVDSDLQPRWFEPNAETVREVMKRYGSCATREIGAIFGLSDDETEILLEDLEARAVVRRREVGRGLFWESPSAM